jgi:hypothetical protein
LLLWVSWLKLIRLTRITTHDVKHVCFIHKLSFY